MTDTDDLVRRLRRENDVLNSFGHDYSDLLLDAADLLEQQAARIATLEDESESHRQNYLLASESLDAAANSIAELEKEVLAWKKASKKYEKFDDREHFLINRVAALTAALENMEAENARLREVVNAWRKAVVKVDALMGGAQPVVSPIGAKRAWEITCALKEPHVENSDK